MGIDTESTSVVCEQSRRVAYIIFDKHGEKFMNKFVIGVLIGYLLTSIFSIPPLPAAFWYVTGSGAVMFTMLLFAWWRFNDDLHNGDF